jgi:hypothetical protein
MSKRISFVLTPIANLPQGYYKERLTELVRDPRVATVPVVAVEGLIGDWAAYIGWPHEAQLSEAAKQNAECLYYANHRSTLAATEKQGDKLSEREALALFPGCAGMEYRP